MFGACVNDRAASAYEEATYSLQTRIETVCICWQAISWTRTVFDVIYIVYMCLHPRKGEPA